MKPLKFLIACVLLISTNVLLANVMLPSFEILMGWSSVSFLITLLGFFLEYMCICILIRAHNIIQFGDALFCTLFMNIFSSFIGIILRIPLIGSFIYIGSLFKLNTDIAIIKTITLGDITSGSALLLSYTIVNTLIEVWFPLFWFAPISQKRTFFLVFIANLLSNGVGIFFLAAYKYVYGTFPAQSLI